MKTTAEKIAVMQAFVDGKQIEWWGGYGNTDYALWNRDAGPEPSWDWARFDYRVNQGPLVKWAVVTEGEHEDVVFFDMKESALSYAPSDGRVIKMVEVPE